MAAEQQHEEEAEQPVGGEADPPPAEHGVQGEEDEPDLEETPEQRWERERAEKARRWDAERLAWLLSQIERQEAQLSRGGGRASSGDDGGMEGRLREAKHDEAEARARAAEAERALRQAKDTARRKAHEARLRREAEEAARIEQMRNQREDEERAVEVEAGCVDRWRSARGGGEPGGAAGGCGRCWQRRRGRASASPRRKGHPASGGADAAARRLKRRGRCDASTSGGLGGAGEGAGGGGRACGGGWRGG